MSRRPLRARDQLLYRGLETFLSAAGRLPLGVTRPLGAQIGATAMAISARDRRRARSHLRLAFPSLDEASMRALLRSTARHVGKLLAEVAWLLRATPEEVAEQCAITGLEHLQRPLAAGTGAVLITGHCGNWELCNARVGVAGIPLTIAVRGMHDPRLDRIATALRSRFGAEVVPRGQDAGRRLFAALAANRVNGLLIDQDIRDIPGVFVPFFGRPAWTPSGAASLALRHGCPVVPIFAHRRSDGRHLAEIHPPLPDPPPGPSEERITALTAAATAAIERQIRAYPEQWVWMHRRWRTRPAAAAAAAGPAESSGAAG
jgi:Kdo2-lipid IVA lauroyltransferase/acyltransferase